jgi:tripartite-type tricarboxylate transporter receptor subunit TctC
MKRGLAALLLCCAAGAAPAQEFPSRAVRVIVPYTPGTGGDILARVLAPRFSERWKSAVVVENRPGATGNIGTEAVAKSAADGHTLLLAATSFSTNPALARSLPFDPVKSFAPVGLVATSALAVTVNAQLPARTMREFVELARRQPGKLYYGSPGNGGVQHLAMELLKLDSGIDVVHVPYKGLGGAIADLIAGQVQVLVSALQSVAPHVQAGRLRMLGVMSPERVVPFTDVPTLKEQGLADLEVETWYALFAPAGTPEKAITRVNTDLRSIMEDAAIRDLLAKQGLSAAGGSPEQLGALLRRELVRWARVVNAAGIKAD